MPLTFNSSSMLENPPFSIRYAITAFAFVSPIPFSDCSSSTDAVFILSLSNSGTSETGSEDAAEPLDVSTDVAGGFDDPEETADVGTVDTTGALAGSEPFNELPDEGGGFGISCTEVVTETDDCGIDCTGSRSGGSVAADDDCTDILSGGGSITEDDDCSGVLSGSRRCMTAELLSAENNEE